MREKKVRTIFAGSSYLLFDIMIIHTNQMAFESNVISPLALFLRHIMAQMINVAIQGSLFTAADCAAWSCHLALAIASTF